MESCPDRNADGRGLVTSQVDVVKRDVASELSTLAEAQVTGDDGANTSTHPDSNSVSTRFVSVSGKLTKRCITFLAGIFLKILQCVVFLVAKRSHHEHKTSGAVHLHVT